MPLLSSLDDNVPQRPLNDASVSWHGTCIRKHTCILTTGLEIPGQIEALYPPDPIPTGKLISITLRKGALTLPSRP
jgi:hypothetical protein